MQMSYRSKHRVIGYRVKKRHFRKNMQMFLKEVMLHKAAFIKAKHSNIVKY